VNPERLFWLNTDYPASRQKDTSSIEGVLHTILPLWVRVMGMPEVLLQALLLSALLCYWVDHPPEALGDVGAGNRVRRGDDLPAAGRGRHKPLPLTALRSIRSPNPLTAIRSIRFRIR
jgi:hypothetical protein